MSMSRKSDRFSEQDMRSEPATMRNAFIGSAIERIEDRAFCAGAADTSTISRATACCMR